MRILQINKYYWPKGGADRYMLELSDLLTSHGHEVIPFAMRDSKNMASIYDRYFVSPVETAEVRGGWQGLRTFARLLYSFEAARKMRELIHRTRPDVAHVHNVYGQISPSILDVLKQEKVPIVMSIHDYHLIAPNYMLWHSGQTGSLAHKSIASLTLSKFHKDSYTASFAQGLSFKLHRSRGSYKRTIDHYLTSSQFVENTYVAAGFKREAFTQLPLFTSLLAEAPRYHDDGYILYYGRLVEEKGVEILLQAMKELPGVPCKIVGTGPEEHHLHIEGDKMPNVTFEGYQSGEALWDLVRGARAVIVPSLWHEVFGLVAIEAMALGKPVIASRVGALSEVVADAQTGLLFEPGDVRGLRQAIARVAEDPVYATSLGRAGRIRAEQNYTPEGHYQKILEVYEKLMDKKRACLH